MPGCPNCGRRTARTEDWACQWCGYPLRSDAFPVIHMTYAQLQAERLAGRATPRPMDARAEKETHRLEETARRKAETAAREQAKKQTEEERHQMQAEDRKTRIVSKDTASYVTDEAERAHLEDEAWEEAMRMSREQAERERSEAEERAAAASAMAAEKEAAANAMELSVDEFIEDFNSDNNAAHRKYTNTTLRLTGKVARVVANEINNNYAITLTGERAEEGLRDVRCKFGIEHADKVKQLGKGEKVTVQGDYAGVVVDINLRDCLFV